MLNKLNDNGTRILLAIFISFGGLIVVGILGAGVLFSTDQGFERKAQTVFTAILPLVGTWVGTVLAFYFAKENFEAASKSTRDLLGIDERLRSIPVRDVMIPIDKADKHVVPASTNPGQIKLQDLAKLMKNKNRNRLPVLDPNGAAVFVVHLSTLTEFLSDQPEAAAGSWPARADLTIEHLKQKADKLYAKILAWGCVKAGATLGEAKIVMESKPDCGDVFVTESGRPGQPVLGWVTNVEIGQRSKA